MVGLLAILAVAWAQVPDPDAPRTPAQLWAIVQEARTIESIDGDVKAAIARYTHLVHNELPAGDPSLSEALYWLAEARWSLGDAAGARDALDACIRSGIGKLRCVDLRSHIDREEESVRTVPVQWSFDSPDHGFFHPRQFWDKGAIRLRDEDGDSVLAWSTQVDALKGDQLVVGFHDPQVVPRTIRFRARSVEVTALLEIELVDVHGTRFAPTVRTWTLPPGIWVTVVVLLSGAQPLDDPDGDALDPSELYQFVVSDATGLTGVAGRNELQLDDFSVR